MGLGRILTLTFVLGSLSGAVSTAAPNSISASLYNDPIYAVCRNQHITQTKNESDTGLKDLSAEFACVYAAQDYRAAEVIGEAFILAGGSPNQSMMYHLANAFYLRGNSSKARQYAILGYSRVTNSDKGRCSNTDSCADLRGLLTKVDPKYRGQFAAEDAKAKAQADAAARQARTAAAEAARAAAAVALDISGSGSHSTEVFSVNQEWALDWSYDCSNFSDGTGNFIVNVNGDVSTLGVNQLGSVDSGTEYFHQGGNVYLEINSECSWTVKVINE
jgi:hypothetical protein